ncbi:Serine/threonine-protein kinase PCRK1 [Camellia lanceoleosa]|uniref:Serine/threonine-protein kinase PCRK1 n=1 Tax=Camellia lanceoleosa TaxID=1840588 RepID=A0ACC0FXZ1_9ERIC|nr:Serine/threonine-protein kinase PCRK1 [Camellia lanceoleosa]
MAKYGFLVLSNAFVAFTFQAKLLDPSPCMMQRSGFRGWVSLLMGLISFPGCGLIKCYIGHKEWINEMNLLRAVKHPNLVKVVGYCAKDDDRGIQRLLVYELMCNNSLEDHLLAQVVSPLPWMARLKIAQDAARGLAYLHG